MADLTTVGAVGFAVSAGVLTFFSPCAYALLPGYVGFYVGRSEGESTLAGSLLRGLVAGAGVLVVLGVFLAATYAVGSRVADVLSVVEPAVGAALIVLGILIVFDRAPSLSIQLPKRRTGILGFGLFGAGYAAASAGCVAPAVIAVSGLALSGSAMYALAVIGSYVLTVAILMVSVTVAAGTGLSAGGDWVMAHRGRLEQAAGVLLVLAGLGQLYVYYAVDFTFAGP
ncbi:cytochrome c biogenesis protein [Halovivax ruber XH-70]|uniref:Cytochrome c biogenesis protein n=1 Tax=Halovivax ruber (strain DSM 18193 / JCM 13892 / XH-70) TaxID=797302 RepID=L0IDD4_HALRX|nr:cytochrome c biogenesis protein CcdA [Halovivax ruber]AGB17570.1 cytochrome c biogenesis protein [Halovivax ruber XH-70]